MELAATYLIAVNTKQKQGKYYLLNMGEHHLLGGDVLTYDFNNIMYYVSNSYFSNCVI